jgi:hypothetical protein
MNNKESALEHLEPVKRWLEKCHCNNVKKVRIRIGKKEWAGCYYDRTSNYQAGMMIVVQGRKTVNDTYTTRHFYLLGARPKHRRSERECYPYEGQDWYVSSYIEEIKPQFAEFHPFGISFQLGCWDVPDCKIDDHEPKPYKRIPLIVEYL